MEEVGASGVDAGFFGAGHGVAAEEGGVGVGEEGFELADDAAFDAADVGDEGAGGEGEAGELGGEGGHDFDRGGEDDKGGA